MHRLQLKLIPPGVYAALLLMLLPAISWADNSQRLMQMLDYVGVDYPPTVANGEVIDSFEYAEMEEFSGEIMNLLASMPANPEKENLIQLAGQVQFTIEQRLPGEQVTKLTQQIKESLVNAYQLQVGPGRLPNMKKASSLYASECASCHGAMGRGDGANAVGMQPAPSDFHDTERQYSRSVYDLYNTLSLGVPETAMRAFTELNDDERWALAFWVSRFSTDDARRDTGRLLWQQGVLREHFRSIDDLAAMSSAKIVQIGAAAGLKTEDAEAVLAYLRAEPGVLEVSDHEALDKSIEMLALSLGHAKAGDSKQAHRAALAAYLDGFEMAEPSLVVADKALKKSIEKEMIAFRELSKLDSSANNLANNITALEAKQQQLVGLLTQAKQTLSESQMSPSTAFAGSFIILLREGVEAILVLAAIMAALIKTGRREAMRYIHMGWISAIVAGILTWWVAGNLISISGASREMTEGIAALFAAVILVYVGFWLHNASHSNRWKQYIEHKIGNAMQSSTLWVLAFVVFLAVYREMFETVLFYQSMWLQLGEDSHQGFIFGIVAAIAALVILSFLILRAGIRLPIKLFFQVNAILLFLLAVVFTGQGIAALQETGLIASSLVDFPSVELLGIYPTLQSLSLQLIVFSLGVVLLLYQRKTN